MLLTCIILGLRDVELKSTQQGDVDTRHTAQPKEKGFSTWAEQLSQNCSCMQKINTLYKSSLTLPALPRFSVCHLFPGINLNYFLHRGAASCSECSPSPSLSNP